jgi:hypothetical protein
MPLFNSQIRRREIATSVVVEVSILLALGFAVVRYVEWSSDTAVEEFMSAAEPSASDPTCRTPLSLVMFSKPGVAKNSRKAEKQCRGNDRLERVFKSTVELL